MKKLLTFLSLAGLLCNTALCQTDTNAPSWFNSPVLSFAQEGSNWVYGVTALYDTTDKTFGESIFAGYKATQVLVPVIELAAKNSGKNAGCWVPQGNITLQIPMKVFGVDITPISYTGLATSLNNTINQNNGQLIGVFGAGGYLSWGGSSPWLPKGAVAGWQRWTGGGFNDNMIRFAFYWHKAPQ